MSTTGDRAPDAGVGSRAQRTLQRVAEGLETKAVAGISEIVKLVEALAANALNISVAELAELIEKDVVVTAKVIAAANTLGYNPSGIEVTSIAQAIHVIGFARIRSLAMSLMLMENAERGQGAAAQRETATLALTSGMMAQAWAEAQARGDGEQAFLCGSLRNFGRLLMSAIMPADDEQARSQAVSMGDADAAYRDVFGLTPLELGYELLRSSNLPEPLLQGLRPFLPQMLEAKVLHPADELLVVAEFSVQLSQLVLHPGLTVSAYADRSRALLQKFGPHLHVDAEVLRAIFERAEQRMSAFGQAFGLQVISRTVTQRMAARRQGNPVPGAPVVEQPAGIAQPGTAVTEKAANNAVPTQQQGMPRSASPGETMSPDATVSRTEGTVEAEAKPLLEVLHELMARTAESLGQPVVRDEVVAEGIAQSLRQGWRADEVVVLLERGKGSFAPVAGAGTRWRVQRNRIVFRREDRTVLGVAAARCEPVLIHDATDAKIASYLPDWLRTELQLGSCIVVPGGDSTQTHSVLLVGWRTHRKIVVQPEELRSLRALLGMVLTARRLAGC